MATSKRKILSVGPVDTYAIQLNVGTSEASAVYPATTELSTDTFWRLIISKLFDYGKTSVVLEQRFQLQLRGDPVTDLVELYSRYFSAAEDSVGSTNLQGNESVYSNTKYGTLFEFPQMILPPGVQIAALIVTADATSSCRWEGLMLEARDIKHLLPFIGGPADFSGVASSFGT